MTRTATGAAAGPVMEGHHQMPVLLSVNVGLPENVAWRGKTVYTGIWKHPVHGPAMVRRLNIDGDGQGDLNGHGGEQRTVLAYQIQAYQHWQRYFGREDFSYGTFGEDLTVDGLPDDEVCIGDRYRIGEAEFEVTQPRVTCYRVGLRLGEPELPALLVSHHRPSFYMRVIREGHVQAGDEIVKIRTGPGALTVASTDALLYLPGRDPGKLRPALQIPALSPGWQDSFRDLLAAADGDNTVGATPPGAEPAELGPGWPGFRKLRVTKVVPESAEVSSICLAAVDGAALPAARAGQYLTLQITGAGQPAPVRSYLLSSAPDAGTYRISVKHEPHGTASSYLNRDLQPGAILEVAAPRSDFVLDNGTGPVLLISAGIGVTTVLSMLHQLAGRHSERDIWCLHGAHGAREHPFAAEAHALLAMLPHAREHVFYSTATPLERHRVHAAPRRLTKEALAGLAIPASAERLRLRPSLVHGRHAGRPHRDRRRPGAHPHRAVRGPAIDQPGPDRADPAAAPPAGRSCRNRAAGHLRPQRHHRAVRSRPAQRARPSRRLRRPNPLELPDWCLPHLHHPPALRRHHLCAGPAGTPSRRAGAHLLRPAQHRHRPGM